MARRKTKVRGLSSLEFSRKLPSLTQKQVDRYVTAHRGNLTPLQVSRILDRQHLREKLRGERKTALGARERFRPRKSDWGRIVFIGAKGEREPQKASRKGYPVYVTSTGKKRLIKQRSESHPYAARRKKSLELPQSRNLRRKVKEFRRAELVETGRGTVQSRGRGKVAGGGKHDFRDKIVTQIAKNLKKTIEAQRSQRSFLIQAVALLRHPDGSTSTIEFEVPIAKADHISIKLGGLKNFVNQKFYSFMARELQYAGFISQGSSSHIASVLGVSQVGESEWSKYHAQKGHFAFMPEWSAPRFETVTIESIEWRTQQSK